MKLKSLAGVFFFAVRMSATVECAIPLQMVQLFSEINGLYITAYWPDGALRVDSVAYSHASTFEVHVVPGHSDQWQLRALKNNFYVSAANGGGSICTADRAVASGWETFTVTELANNRVQLKTFDGHFLGIDGRSTSSLIATATKANSWETFKVVDVPQRRGVNLGSWFVPEKWMFENSECSELWAGTNKDVAVDLHTLSKALGQDEISHRMKRHWSTWLTQPDFAIMASQGINHVRIPIGYWDIVESPPYAFGGAYYIDQAIKWAAAQGITVSIDLHGAPGSQNGADHSGQKGGANWHKDPENVRLTVKVLGMISERWGKDPAVWGIEMLNEPGSYQPGGAINHELLTRFYREGYAAIRQHSPTVHVVMNSFVGPHEWIRSVLPEPQYRNVVLDLHFYTAWSGFTQEQQYYNQAADWGAEIRALTPYYPVVIGEMSLATGKGFPPEKLQLFADASMKSFVENAYGFVFWSYKLRGKDEAWAFKDAFNYVKDYYLPVSVEHCGCNSCTQAVWDKIVTDSAGSFSCGSRITWLQTQGSSEAAACQKVASEFPAVCLCDSMLCKAGPPTFTSPTPTSYCGCNSCTQTVWDKIVTDSTGSFSCGSRIIWLQNNQCRSEASACDIVGSEFPAECLCGSMSCRTPKPTNEPTTYEPTTYEPTSTKPTIRKPTFKPTTQKPTFKPTTRKPSKTSTSTTRKPTSMSTTRKPTSMSTTRKPVF